MAILNAINTFIAIRIIASAGGCTIIINIIILLSIKYILREMTVVVTNYTGERPFSQLKRIKNELRTGDQFINNVNQKWYI